MYILQAHVTLYAQIIFDEADNLEHLFQNNAVYY